MDSTQFSSHAQKAKAVVSLSNKLKCSDKMLPF